MYVAITESKTLREITKIEINFRALNYAQSLKEYFDIAWKAAVSDGDVKANCRDEYSFKLIGGSTIPSNLKLEPNVRYHLYADSNKSHSVGFIENDWFHEGRHDGIAGRLTDGILYFSRKPNDGAETTTTVAGTLEGDCIVRIERPNERYKLIPANQ